MRMHKYLPAAALLLAATTVRADDRVDCKHAMTQLDINTCAAQDFAAADAKLNRTYKTLISKLDANELAALKTAQRAWITWRDAKCNFETIASEGGSIRPMEFLTCQTQLTNDRSEQLAKQIECPAGNLACPAN
jgi:uncharacterized protein YecT (DUF1311 family)